MHIYGEPHVAVIGLDVPGKNNADLSELKTLLDAFRWKRVKG
jgi:hypothetical protein